MLALMFNFNLTQASECYTDACCNDQCYFSYPNSGSPFYRYRIKEDKTSQSFMLFHPTYQQAAMRQALWHNFVYNKTNKQANAFQLISFYDQSIDTKATAKYFLPFRKCDDSPCRFIAGDHAGINKNDDATIRRNRDIRAEWLGLPSNFSGNFCVNPQQRHVGIIGEFHTDLEHYIDWDFVKGFWLSITVPIIAQENKLNLEQWNVRNPGIHFPHNIPEAFCQPSWNFGKICCSRSTIGVAEVDLRVGRAYYSKDNFQLIYYSGLSIPASPRQNAQYLYDSYIGYNGHLGIEAGLNTQIVLNKDTSSYAVCFFANLDTVFLMDNKQRRTFDLRCKPWSRFLPFVRKNGPPDITCPGVNVLTFLMRVYPYNATDFSCGWRITSKHFEAEIGYSVWGHGDERLEYVKNFDESTGYEKWGITGTYNPQINDVAVTASKSNILCQAPNDPEFVSIGQCDIDLDSGRARSAICHKAHFSIGSLHKGRTINSFFGGGAYVELPQTNTALNRWGFWLKCGAIF